MKALITGASSGIGREIANVLSKMGYDLILVARRVDRLCILKEELDCTCDIIECDLSWDKNCFELFEKTKNEDIEILVNCAGYGVFGNFSDTDIYREINMINVNIVALHILTKSFVKKFIC